MEMMHRTVRIAVSINKITYFTRMDTLIDVFLTISALHCNTVPIRHTTALTMSHSDYAVNIWHVGVAYLVLLTFVLVYGVLQSYLQSCCGTITFLP